MTNFIGKMKNIKLRVYVRMHGIKQAKSANAVNAIMNWVFFFVGNDDFSCFQ